MSTDLRRSKRQPDYLPIHVNAVDNSNDIISGPFSGRIIDLSAHGACLLMTQIMVDSYHVFHSTLENDAALLQLTFDLPYEGVNLAITARPVWFDVFRQNEIRAFKMGIEFMDSLEGKQMKKLHQAIKKQQRKRGDWWALHGEDLKS